MHSNHELKKLYLHNYHNRKIYVIRAAIYGTSSGNTQNDIQAPQNIIHVVSDEQKLSLTLHSARNTTAFWIDTCSRTFEHVP